jgi:LysM repeat protein
MDRIDISNVDERQSEPPVRWEWSDVYGGCGNPPASHSVKKGETLWSIAKDNIGPPDANDFMIDGFVKQIAAENKLADPGKIYAGEKLSIPSPCDPSEKQTVSENAERPPETLDQTAQRLADYFKTATSVSDAAKLLSQDLFPRLGTLDTDNREYNNLIEKIYAQLPADSKVALAATGWNSATHTWDRLIVTGEGYPDSPPVRIVQPGNTIEDLVGDRVGELQARRRPVDPNFTEKFKELNNLEDNSDLNYMRGKPVYFPG